MAYNVKEKKIKCFEWSVNIPSVANISLRSESFFFKQQKFNLKFENTGTCTSILYFECDKNFRESINIRVNVTNTQISDYSKTFNLSGGIKEVWRYNYGFEGVDGVWRYNYGFQGRILWTFEVIFMTGTVKESGTISASDASQGKTSSYLKQKNHFQALSRDFSKLLKDDNFDVTITCENKSFHAHRTILESRSTVFCAMLKSDMVEGKTGLITLKDIKLPIFENFLIYLYSGILPKLNMDTAKEFYKVGDQYAVKELKMACSEFMIKNLIETNACEIVVLADLHCDEDFRKQVIEYIVQKNIPRKVSNWSNFCKSHSFLANEILNLYIEKHCNC